jgi:hypothetical protein
MYLIALNGNYLLMDNNLELCKSLLAHKNKRMLMPKFELLLPKIHKNLTTLQQNPFKKKTKTHLTTILVGSN